MYNETCPSYSSVKEYAKEFWLGRDQFKITKKGRLALTPEKITLVQKEIQNLHDHLSINEDCKMGPKLMY